MERDCGLIHNLLAETWWTLSGGFAPPAAWQTTAVFFIVLRLRLSRLSTFSGKCQLFQESVNFFRKESNCQEKTLSTFSGKQQISVNQNQEKTRFFCCVAVVAVQNGA